MSNIDHRFSLLGIISGLMVSEHLGDVHDEINHLCDLVGIPRPQGNFEDDWTDEDWRNVRREEDPRQTDEALDQLERMADREVSEKVRREDAQAVATVRSELERLRDDLADCKAARLTEAQAADERARRLEDGLRAVKKAERAASRAHDAMWAMDFDKTSAGSAEREEWKRLREQASNEIWKLHEQLRPLLARLDRIGKEDTP